MRTLAKFLICGALTLAFAGVAPAVAWGTVEVGTSLTGITAPDVVPYMGSYTILGNLNLLGPIIYNDGNEGDVDLDKRDPETGEWVPWGGGAPTGRALSFRFDGWLTKTTTFRIRYDGFSLWLGGTDPGDIPVDFYVVKPCSVQRTNATPPVL